VYHFTEEEKLLQQKGFPLSDIHRQAHKEFIEKISDFNAKFKAGKMGVTYEMMGFLRKWLIEHIQGTDMKYASLFAVGWK
jgi:hemerythrin